MASGPLLAVLASRALGAAWAARAREQPPRQPGRGGLGRRALVGGVLLVSVLVIVLVAVPRAGAEWSPPFDLSPAGETGERPQVAVDPSGNATVVWSGFDGVHAAVHARRIDASGALGAVQDVSEPGEQGEDPQVDVDAAGNATIVWNQFNTPDGMARARRMTAAGVLEDPKDISSATESALEPRLAVDPSGNAVVVWVSYDGVGDIVRARRIDAHGGLGATLDVSTQVEFAFRQQVALDPAGNAVIVWQSNSGPDSVIRARPIDVANGFLPIVTLSGGGERAFSPQVAFDGSGRPTAAWLRSDGTIQARQTAPGGGLGPIEDLSAVGAASVGPELAVDRSGSATVVWPRFDGVNETIELRRIASNRAVGEIVRLSAGGDDSEPQVAVDDVGNATVVWLHRSDAGFTVQSRTVSPGGQLGPTVDVAPPSEELMTPRVATDPSGSSTAVWGRDGDSGNVIAGARFLAPAPAPPLLVPPASSAPAPALPAPASASPAAAPDPSASCPLVTLKKLAAYTAHQPKAGSRRTKGVGTKLTLNRAGRLQLLTATLAYTARGKRRTVKLRTKQLTAAGKQPKLRFRLPGKRTHKVGLGTRVRLKVKLRARSTDAGCGFGKAKTLEVRTKLIWVARSAAI